MALLWSSSHCRPTTPRSSASSTRPGKFTPFFPNDQFASFIVSATVGSFAIELVYLILAVVAFRLVAKSGNKPWQYVVVAAAVVMPILGFYGALNPAPHDSSNYNWVAACTGRSG